MSRVVVCCVSCFGLVPELLFCCNLFCLLANCFLGGLLFVGNFGGDLLLNFLIFSCKLTIRFGWFGFVVGFSGGVGGGWWVFWSVLASSC